MKRIPLLLIFLALMPAFAEDGPIYPGTTFYLTPSYSTEFIKGFRGASRGGGIGIGLDFEELQDHPLLLGLGGGYGYLAEEGYDTELLPYLSFKIGWIVRPSELFRLLPYGGLSFVRMDSPALFTGCSADFRIYQRNYFFVNISLTGSTGGNDDGRWAVGVGLKRPVPILKASPPLTLDHSLSTRTFSPDGNGESDELEIILNTMNGASCQSWSVAITDHLGNPVINWKGRGKPPERISWEGYSAEGEMVFSASDYRVNIEMEDKLGNRISRSDYFVTDIFVENVDDQLRIRIPGILFSAGTADFQELSQEELNKNEEIITALRASLDKFPEYDIQIEGYGNLLHWASEEKAEIEQREVLIPLSRARAARIKDYLVAKGVDADRLKVVGRGGESPLVPFGDEENRWKNRRVEFILLK